MVRGNKSPFNKNNFGAISKGHASRCDFRMSVGFLASGLFGPPAAAIFPCYFGRRFEANFEKELFYSLFTFSFVYLLNNLWQYVMKKTVHNSSC